MKIINIIEIDGKEVIIDELPEEQQREIWTKINISGMTKLGYRVVEPKDGTA